MTKQSNPIKYLRLILVLAVITSVFSACGDEEASATFSADFSFEFIDDNNVRFTNQSEGEYYLLDWDFANGETAANSDKSKVYEMYYRQAGVYNVRLTVIDFDGNRETVKKDVTITNNDLVVAFTATVDAGNSNKINLVNTSVGEYDSFKWIYRGKEILGETNAVAYFPFAGSYEIELQLTKGGNVFSEKQTVNISGDDPEYIDSFVLSWADEFDGTAVNTSDWTFETGASGWGNNELQNYTNGANAEVKDGLLVLTARKINDNTAIGSYTSTRLISSGKKEFTYGKMEIRAKLPSGKGIWPAIWMLGANIGSVSWPACGEIDIMEYVGYQPNTVHATVHTNAGSGSNGSGSSKTLATAEEEFHVYGLIWTEKEMIFYTDSPENVTHRYAPSVKNADNWPFDKPQFFILNVAVGGNWGGAQGIDNSIFPQSMEIDYVRVYQPLE
ncbi:family 16 glycosylhydrolase [uncultured Draconibacterium sp.]|uniref:family 16 glycosylhydrolase n=1 Tax=uncultured Draconibacterium sp. TaxID=1573823 RepID=UPI003217B011